jgi:hypothetical protein
LRQLGWRFAAMGVLYRRVSHREVEQIANLLYVLLSLKIQVELLRLWDVLP